jgi:hypothetical protein
MYSVLPVNQNVPPSAACTVPRARIRFLTG